MIHANNTDDPTRRTDLRTVEPHYSAAEVYAALDCSYPFDRQNITISGHGYSKVRDSSAVEPDGRRSDSIRGDDISASHSSSAAAVRRHVGSSGFETHEYARYDRTNGGEEHRTVTDGGHERERDPNEFDPGLGESVVDRAVDDPNTAVVVALPEEPAYDYTLDALDGSPSVADLNPEYAASGPVATVAFAGELDAALDVWHEADPAALAGLCDDEGVRTYTYPVARLREVGDE